MATTIIYGTRATGIPEASTDRGGLWLSFADLERATGWERKPQGLCAAFFGVALARFRATIGTMA